MSEPQNLNDLHWFHWLFKFLFCENPSTLTCLWKSVVLIPLILYFAIKSIVFIYVDPVSLSVCFCGGLWESACPAMAGWSSDKKKIPLPSLGRGSKIMIFLLVTDLPRYSCTGLIFSCRAVTLSCGNWFIHREIHFRFLKLDMVASDVSSLIWLYANFYYLIFFLLFVRLLNSSYLRL